MPTLPTQRWITFRLEPERIDYLSPVVKGRIGSVTAGWPLWRLEAEARLNIERDSEALVAWLNSLRGAQIPFLAGPERTLPMSHVNGLPGGWDGDAASWSVNTSRDVLTLTGLPVGMTLSAGDHVGFRWGAEKAALVRVTETKTGSTQALPVYPAVPTIVPSNAVAYVSAPKALFRLAPDTEIGPMRSNRTKQVIIRAVQDLIA